MGASLCSAKQASELKWDKSRALAHGANKGVFSGTYRGESVVVCHARATNEIDIQRAKNEINVLRHLGEHPNIIKMFCDGVEDGRPYLVLEIVEPVGFDLDRLWSQYEKLGGKVPSNLCGRLYRQMIAGLAHMHSKNQLHLDLKTQNVLVTYEYNAKLCDFGIAIKSGTTMHLVAGYMSPEMCNGKKLGPEADCWGLGLILHQMYKRGEWNLVNCTRRPMKLRPGMPSKKGAMPSDIEEVMIGLIKDEPEQRLTLDQMMQSKWLAQDASTFENSAKAGEEWTPLPQIPADASEWLVPYRGSSRPLTITMKIGEKQKHLQNKSLFELGLGEEFPDPEEPINVLLVKPPGKGETIARPGADTNVSAGYQIFLGVPAESENCEAALQKIEDLQSGVVHHNSKPRQSLGSGTDLMKNHNLHDDDKKSKRQIEELGAMYSFAMEFDCFTFPKHIGSQATIGSLPMVGPAGAYSAPKHIALNLKQIFNINLAGIQRVGEKEPEWFPTASALVRPGDLGLVARLPNEDGSSTSSVNKEDVQKLLDEGRFQSIVQNCSVYQPKNEGVARHSNPDLQSVFVYRESRSGSQKIGEIPNGTKVQVMEEYDEFLLVTSGAASGWVGVKNIQASPSTASSAG